MSATIVDADDSPSDQEDLSSGRDRTGLPSIPLRVPPSGDRIDIDAIQSEFNTRATKRASPSGGASGGFDSASYPATSSTKGGSKPIPMRTMASSSGPATRVEPVPLEEDDEFDDLDYEPPERRPTHKKLPKKTAFTASFLLGVGIIFSTLGLSFLFTLGLSEALPFLIIGGIGFIPGSYVSFIIYQTWRGVPGYSYDQIPSYDD